jgi:glycosyltransferase involved in cell wall biosynthesis
VIGDGPERDKIKAAAGSNVELLGRLSQEELISHMGRARAFVFAAQEDFGIVPLEAQACGTPVIAFGKGGSLETVEGPDGPSPTGVFFYDQTAAAIRDAIALFERNDQRFSPENCRLNASRFSRESFERQFREVVQSSFRKNLLGKNLPQE